MKWIGIGPPLIDNRRILPEQSDLQLIKNDIIQLLLTSPGQRIFRPDFGTPLKSRLFEQNEDNYGSLESEILLALNRYEPRVLFNSVKIVWVESQQGLYVKINGTLRDDPAVPITIDQLVGKL